jgi:hypothetical protein
MSKDNLKDVMLLNAKILDIVPRSDSMRETFSKLADILSERYDTYEQFKVNPYKVITQQPKMNSDTKLDLGEYKAFDKHQANIDNDT